MATIANGTGAHCLACFSKDGALTKHTFGRPEPGPGDVAIDIKFCGMCHSDVHATNGDWGIDLWPMAPGHEIAGIVSKVGPDVTTFRVGDRVGVGCFVDCCRECEQCKNGQENYCTKVIQTYSSTFPEGRGGDFENCAGYWTNGGYSDKITVWERFVFHIPESMSLEVAAPLLCAGVTTFYPLNDHILKKGGGEGKKVGVVGFGGLGQVATKIAKAMGCEVVLLSRNKKKEAEAKALGASLIAHSDEEEVKSHMRSFDLIIDTVSASHEVMPLLSLLKISGVYHLLGAVATPFSVVSFPVIFGNYNITGSLVGGVPDHQAMLDFCAKHDVKPDIKVIHAKDAAAQFEALHDGKSDTLRAVIDMSTLKDM